MDDTFDCRLHPVIAIDGAQYFMIAKCFSSTVIQGHATHVWFVTKSVPAGSDLKDIIMIKDSRVNVEHQLSEEQIFEALKDIDCVPKVEKAWTVQWDGQDDLTSLLRPEAFYISFQAIVQPSYLPTTRAYPCRASDHTCCESPRGCHLHS
jgi:hypothetical protein